MLCFGKTDVGKKRNVNQDSFKPTVINSTTVLAVVCDGMGGAAGGGVAGNLAAETFTQFVCDHITELAKKKSLSRSDEHKIRGILVNAAASANSAVFERATSDVSLHGMGTTLVATLAICGMLFTVNIGDSRMYLISEGSIRQITHDHSYVQYLVDTGRLSPEDAKKSTNRNIITRAVGTDRTVEADVFINKAIRGNFVLLCSDGLVNHVPADKIYAAVDDIGDDVCEESINRCLELLINEANDCGGSDNITAMIMAI